MQVISSAKLSRDGVYRFQLMRSWEAALPMVLWVMLNPSTADANKDDRTIGRCREFSKRWGMGGMHVGNLYALRATDPRALRQHDDPHGMANSAEVRQMAKACAFAVAGWGAHSFVDKYYAASLLGGLGIPVKCLGLTKGGAPRHPLYVAGNTPLVDYVFR